MCHKEVSPRFIIFCCVYCIITLLPWILFVILCDFTVMAVKFTGGGGSAVWNIWSGFYKSLRLLLIVLYLLLAFLYPLLAFVWTVFFLNCTFMFWITCLSIRIVTAFAQHTVQCLRKLLCMFRRIIGPTTPKWQTSYYCSNRATPNAWHCSPSLLTWIGPKCATE